MNTRKNRGIGSSVLLTIVIILFVALWFTNLFDQREDEVTWKEFESLIEEGEARDIIISQNKAVPTGRIEFTVEGREGKELRYLYVSDVNEIQDYLKEKKLEYEMPDVPQENWFATTILPVLLTAGAILIVFYLMNRQGGGANSKAMSFGKSRARLSTESDKKIMFSQVAGLREEKEELEEIVDFLRTPKKYIQVGARIPKGVLLVGPPGTGKTLLAKAVAGEAGVPFFTISGSDFVEMFVGVGASRVRDLFEDAKRNAPCIIFIDEIDAVARRRGTGMGGGHDEREQTLNQLLVEMDGFGVNEGIIVMAATNRVDILDPAILRPGRFDRKVIVGRPDVGGREEILRVHAKGKPLSEEIDLKQIAQTTAGFTGADLENLLNEAAIIAAKEDRMFLKQEDIKKAFVKVGIGAEKKSKIISDKEKKITAFHEAGHAILFHVLPDVGPVYSVSIIPTGGAGGYTMPLPEKDEMFNTKGKMLQDITVALGGRVAEEEVFDDITTGASQDIKQATSLAKSMVTKFGMSEEIGLINYDDDGEEVFIGRDLAHTHRRYGEGVATVIDREVKRIIDECYANAKEIIRKYDHVLHACAKLLLEKEKISREEFEALFIGEEKEILFTDGLSEV
ncbi:MAG: ATP-dependent zinc metalloprotease FtsH [Lachnospiraceae bacterium]